mmetsp:Transcript_36698/g.103554  ORF Transcript_36698/g.103554 Transcript_36698/m.103554 type:complete len:286 (+) Transcript_36698:2-859(+)
MIEFPPPGDPAPVRRGDGDAPRRAHVPHAHGRGALQAGHRGPGRRRVRRKSRPRQRPRRRGRGRGRLRSAVPPAEVEAGGDGCHHGALLHVPLPGGGARLLPAGARSPHEGRGPGGELGGAPAPRGGRRGAGRHPHEPPEPERPRLHRGGGVGGAGALRRDGPLRHLRRVLPGHGLQRQGARLPPGGRHPQERRGLPRLLQVHGLPELAVRLRPGRPRDAAGDDADDGPALHLHKLDPARPGEVLRGARGRLQEALQVTERDTAGELVHSARCLPKALRLVVHRA